MRIGLFGLAAAGKRSLFGLLCGIDPAGLDHRRPLAGVAPVVDSRIDWLTGLYRPKKVVHATLDFQLMTDIPHAGADREALAPLAQVDLLCPVVRAFADDAVYHPEGRVDPARDLAYLAGELALFDLAFAERRLERLAKEKKGTGPVDEVRLFERVRERLESGLPVGSLDLAPAESVLLAENYRLLTARPVLAVVDTGEGQPLPAPVTAWAAGWGASAVAVPVQVERELAALPPADRAVFMEAYGIDRPALETLSAAACAALDLIPFFTVGPDEVRAWMVPRGCHAPRAARAVHQDFERGFIRAEVMKYAELREMGTEEKVRAAGKYLTKGRDYVVEDGDILNFLFNV